MPPALIASSQTTLSAHTTEPSRLVSVVVATLAFGGGAIHAAVIRHHLEYVAVTTGFAAMAAAQWWFAFRMLRCPTGRVRLLGAALHVAIVATWLLSRTVGVAVVPGAKDPALVGFADVTANVFSLAVIAALAATWSPRRRGRRPVVPRRFAGRIAVAVAVGVLLATVPAVLAGHDHTGPNHPAGDTTSARPDHEPPDDSHDDSHHDSHDHG